MSHLLHYEFAPALVTYLEESVTGHILDPWMYLMHELKQLIHHSLEKLPVSSQKLRVLADNIPEWRWRWRRRRFRSSSDASKYIKCSREDQDTRIKTQGSGHKDQEGLREIFISGT